MAPSKPVIIGTLITRAKLGVGHTGLGDFERAESMLRTAPAEVDGIHL